MKRRTEKVREGGEKEDRSKTHNEDEEENRCYLHMGGLLTDSLQSSPYVPLNVGKDFDKRLVERRKKSDLVGGASVRRSSVFLRRISWQTPS